MSEDLIEARLDFLIYARNARVDEVLGLRDDQVVREVQQSWSSRGSGSGRWR